MEKTNLTKRIISTTNKMFNLDTTSKNNNKVFRL